MTTAATLALRVFADAPSAQISLVSGSRLNGPGLYPVGVEPWGSWELRERGHSSRCLLCDPRRLRPPETFFRILFLRVRFFFILSSPTVHRHPLLVLDPISVPRRGRAPERCHYEEEAFPARRCTTKTGGISIHWTTVLLRYLSRKKYNSSLLPASFVGRMSQRSVAHVFELSYRTILSEKIHENTDCRCRNRARNKKEDR